jgi:hypothetical protein
VLLSGNQVSSLSEKLVSLAEHIELFDVSGNNITTLPSSFFVFFETGFDSLALRSDPNLRSVSS